jgi:hypothetical protein
MASSAAGAPAEPAAPAPRAGFPAAAAVTFLSAGGALFAQVLVHRLISAKLLNNYAFLVISLTMLGFAAAGVLLTPRLGRLLERRDEHLASFAAWFAISLLAAACLFSFLPAGGQFTIERAFFVRTLLAWLPAALLFAVPFGFVGLILGVVLGDPHLPTRRIYGVDLVGSALGAVAVVPAIRHLGVERSLAACALLVALGCAVALRPRGRGPRLALGAALAAAVAAAAAPAALFPIRLRTGSLLATSVEREGYGLEYVQWDPVARIEISRLPPLVAAETDFPVLMGDHPGFAARFKRMLTQNDHAFAYMVEHDGRRESLEGIDRTIYAAAYQVRAAPNPRALVIGVGGGFDILTALYFEPAQVTGVEVNGATLDIVRHVYRDYCRGWVGDPRVRLVEDDGRHFLATSSQTYDVIQLSGVDSYSGTAGAAHVFSENYLYTREAFDLYLSRLSPQGVLNLMRLEYHPPREMLRALVMAVDALRRAGVAEPARHVVALASRKGNYAAILVKKTPFTPEEEARVGAWADANAFFGVAASPSRNVARQTAYQLFLSLGDVRQERAFTAGYPLDVTPVSDDRPFFFNHSWWSHLVSRDPVVRQSLPAMQLTVLVLFAAVGAAAVVCVYLPLRWLAARDRAQRQAATWRQGVYFAGIALGYLAIEIALLQKLGVFLGHPNYALSVVLASLLLATGLGALWSGAVTGALRGIRYTAYALAFLLVALYLLVFPRLLGWLALPFLGRCLVVAAMVLPVGVLLGAFMPWGLERLKRTAPALIPWAWGINGIFSVLAPVASVAFSMSWGSGALLLSAIPLYLAAALTFGTE